jgi:hypothetical protein
VLAFSRQFELQQWLLHPEQLHAWWCGGVQAGVLLLHLSINGHKATCSINWGPHNTVAGCKGICNL